MTAGSLATRFSALPQMQEERQIESSFQANQAEQLKLRLEETKGEAERAMREEMDRTRQLELEAVQVHPRMRDWIERREGMVRQLQEWQASRGMERQRLWEEMKGLEHQAAFKRQQLEELSEEQSRQRRLQEGIWAEQGRLRTEIEEARRGEAEAMQRLDSTRARLDPLQGQLAGLEEQLAKALRRQEDLQAEYSQQRQDQEELTRRHESLQREQSPLLGQMQEQRQRHAKMMEDVARAKEVVREAKAACEEHYGIFANLEGSVASNEKRIREAQEAGADAMNLKSRTRGLLESCQRKLEGLRGERAGIVGRQREIGAQISRLIREKFDLQSQLDARAGQERELEMEFGCLQADLDKAEEYHRTAVEFQERLSGNHTQVREAFEAEGRLLQQLMGKKGEAEQELREAQALFEAVEREIGLAEPRFREGERMLGEVQQKRDAAMTKVRRAGEELQQLSDQVRAMQGQMMAMRESLTPLLEEQRAANGVLNNCTNALRSLKRRWEETESKLGELPGEDYGLRQERLSAEMASLMGQIDELRRKLQEPEGNPMLEAELAGVEAQRSRVIDEIREELKNDPPAMLTEQLRREAEAVMRAELAAGLCTRQAHIEDEARNLANLHPSTQPRIFLDREAAKALSGQHFDNPDYHDIASLVVKLAEKHHIAAQ